MHELTLEFDLNIFGQGKMLTLDKVLLYCLVAKPGYVAGVDVKLRIVVHVAASVLGQRANRGQVHVGLRCHEQLHRDLGRRKLLAKASYLDKHVALQTA